jgi:hypothetical protein
MPDTYKSFGTILGTTSATTIYTTPSSTTTIVNGVMLSNINGINSTTVTLEAVKGSTAFSLITGAAVPFASTLQAIDAPVVLETGNTLRCTAGVTGYIHAFVSVLEIT